MMILDWPKAPFLADSLIEWSWIERSDSGGNRRIAQRAIHAQGRFAAVETACTPTSRTSESNSTRSTFWAIILKTASPRPTFIDEAAEILEKAACR